MATLPDSVDYTDSDFDALRARLIAPIKGVSSDWTDFDVVSFGILVDLYVYVGDVMHDALLRAAPSVCARARRVVSSRVPRRDSPGWTFGVGSSP